MAEVVNLNRFRKDRQRAEKRAEADANAARFGRTKAEKDLEKQRAAKAARELDAHQRETDKDQE
ncbi:MAG: DUF4169 family protein [Gemmobacter sp.]